MVNPGRHRQHLDVDVPWYESRRRASRRPGWLLPGAAAAGVGLLVVAALAAGTLLPAQVAGRSGCAGPRLVATVAASPDHAPVLRRIAAEWSLDQPRVGESCAEVDVVAAPSATVAATLGTPTCPAPARTPGPRSPASGRRSPPPGRRRRPRCRRAGSGWPSPRW